jgi:hypothetical protein
MYEKWPTTPLMQDVAAKMVRSHAPTQCPPSRTIQCPLPTDHAGLCPLPTRDHAALCALPTDRAALCALQVLSKLAKERAKPASLTSRLSGKKNLLGLGGSSTARHDLT